MIVCAEQRLLGRREGYEQQSMKHRQTITQIQAKTIPTQKTDIIKQI